MRKKCLTTKCFFSWIVASMLTIIVLCGQFKVVCATNEDSDPFSLIDYVSTHDIHSFSEFDSVLRQYCGQFYEPFIVENEVGFEIDVNYDNRFVIVTVVEDLGQTRSVKTGKATRKYYSDSGAVTFTIYVEGRFTYSTNESRTLSVTGAYTPSVLSFWTSTPTLTSGNFSPTLAYAKIYGTATFLTFSQYYSITLMCDNYGNLSAN